VKNTLITHVGNIPNISLRLHEHTFDCYDELVRTSWTSDRWVPYRSVLFVQNNVTNVNKPNVNNGKEIVMD